MADPVRDGASPRKPIDLPFRRSMSAPLLTAFGLLAAGGLGLVIWLVVKPGAFGIPVEQRRTPASGALSHDVGRILLAPVPSPLPATEAPCPELSGVVVEGGPPAQGRLGAVLEDLCGVLNQAPDLREAVRALASARIRFASFGRTGELSAVDRSARRILLNIRLARSRSPVVDIAPLLAHEGFHLARGVSPVTAADELTAREVELLACRLLIDIRRWPRGCRDARAIVALGERAALDALIRAGYMR